MGSTRARTLGVGIAALGLIGLLVACGGSDGSGGTGEVGGVVPDERARDEEPEASDGDAVQSYVEDLLAENDAAVADITAQPELARDPDSPAVQRYLDLYEPGSERAQQLVDAWVQMADAGQRVEPLEAGTPPNVTSLDGQIEVVSADEVHFPYCSRGQLQVVGADGAPVDEPSTDQFPGEGIAVRLDGRWHLRQLELLEEGGTCHTVVVTAMPEGES